MQFYGVAFRPMLAQLCSWNEWHGGTTLEKWSPPSRVRSKESDLVIAQPLRREENCSGPDAPWLPVDPITAEAGLVLVEVQLSPPFVVRFSAPPDQ